MRWYVPGSSKSPLKSFVKRIGTFAVDTGFRPRKMLGWNLVSGLNVSQRLQRFQTVYPALVWTVLSFIADYPVFLQIV